MTDPRFTAVTSVGQSESTIGLRFDRSRGEACAVLLSSTAYPQHRAPELRGMARESISRELTRRIGQLEIDRTTLDERVATSADVTGMAIRLVQSLMRQLGTATDVLAIGSHGCGIWDCRDSEHRSYARLCDASALAEATGITVIDEFPNRDLARGGRGGPVEAYGLWLLLADRTPVPGRRWRAVLEIGPNATQCTLLSPFDDRAKKERIVAKNICVGQRLFSSLTSKFAESGARDNVAKLAVQGKVIAGLIELWTSMGSTGEQWQPDGVSPLPLLYALKDSDYEKMPVTDLLATATSYLAREIAGYIRHCVDHSRPVGEILIMGEGTHNGLLIHQLRELLPAVQLRSLNESENHHSILAGSIAALALLHIWQIPLMPSHGGTPRMLGQLTPGSPSNWQRVLKAMSTNFPWLLPLREAI